LRRGASFFGIGDGEKDEGLLERNKDYDRRLELFFGKNREATFSNPDNSIQKILDAEEMLHLEDFASKAFGKNSGTSASGGQGGSSVSGIRGGKKVTINVENVIREQNINGTTTLGETAEEIREQVSRALRLAFSDISTVGG
jgi:hypothetical protein